MPFTRDTAAEHARVDLASRLDIDETEIGEPVIDDRDFPNASLGAPLEGELSAQMIASGWQIQLDAGGETYEYRADKYQLRLYDFQGENYLLDVD